MSLEKLKRRIENNSSTYFAASIAPSYLLAFSGEDFSSLSILLKKIFKFDFVGETVSILPAMIKEQKKLLRETDHKFINTSCPSIYKMVIDDFPDLKEFLSPLDSPMVTYGRYLKNKFDFNTEVYFFSPCKEKKKEAKNYEAIDGVFTFKEAKEFISEKDIDLEEFSEVRIDQKGPDWARAAVLHYDRMGEEECRERLIQFTKDKKQLKKASQEELAGFIELLGCKGGCLNGSGLEMNLTLEESRKKFIEELDKEKIN